MQRPWLGRLVVAFAGLQLALAGWLALWPPVETPRAALAVAEIRHEVWVGWGFALAGLMALPFFALFAAGRAGFAGKALGALALVATAALHWRMTGEALALLPLREAPLELARGLAAARLQGLGLAALVLAAVLVARRA